MTDISRPAVSSDTGRWTPCPRWAFERLTPAALRVYLALNFRCDHDGDDAWPSYSTLAKETGTSVATVKRAIKECVNVGAIRMENRRDESGDWTSNRYWVFRSDPTLVTPPMVTGDPTPVVVDDLTPMVTDEPQTRTTSNQEPIDLLREAQFRSFIAEYPRKKKGMEARAAYIEALQRAAHDQIMDGLRRNLSDLKADIRRCPYPATWLREDRWEDEPDLATAGEYVEEGW